MGASLARPGCGALATRSTSSRSGTSPCSRSRGCPRTRRAANAREQHGGAAPRPSPRQADDRPRARDGTPHRQRAQVRRRRRARSRSGGAGRGRRRSGRSRCRTSTRPTRAASWPGATSTFSVPRPPRCSRAGQGSRAARRPTPSRRSRARCCLFARRSATSGSSPRTSRRCEPPRRSRRPRACCRAAMLSSSSSKQPSASCWCRARISVNGSGRPASGQARCSSTARSAEPGDGRNTRCGSSPGRRLSRPARDAVEAEAAALPLPIDRPIEVVWSS